MRSIPEQRIAEFQEQDYQLYFGISKLEFDRMLKALHEAYRQEHKRKTRFTKICRIVLGGDFVTRWHPMGR
ncbi:hypothetical protein [Faecalibacterium prausnitzii]|uniref:hypothetical protein n=1 Tax=Faecalibacterium prausnitzii TaxID=853 RepID=UPI001FA89694|nr:hypothetical protein [Faecalibacterium prausnitzii]